MFKKDLEDDWTAILGSPLLNESHLEEAFKSLLEQLKSTYVGPSNKERITSLKEESVSLIKRIQENAEEIARLEKEDEHGP